MDAVRYMETDRTDSDESVSDEHRSKRNVASGTRFVFSWLRQRMHRAKDDTCNTWLNWSVVAGLMTSFAATGLFTAVPVDDIDEFPEIYSVHLMLWCFSTLAFTTATLGFMLLISCIAEIDTDQEFHQFVQHLGFSEIIPVVLFGLAALALYLGICTYFVLASGIQVTICCVVVCALICFIPLASLMFSVSRSLWSVANGVLAPHPDPQHATEDGEVDTIYEELRKYYLVENGSVLSGMSRNVFAARFRPHGEVAELLSKKIYDAWLEKKLSAMVREHPGF